MSKLTLLIVTASLIMITLLPNSCRRPEPQPEPEPVSEKMSGELLNQINLRKSQLASPTADRLRTMTELGMNVDKLDIQRIFIHLTSQLTSAQIEELKALGIALYLDSWLPPVGAHPTGYLLADMPVAKLAELTRKDYVIRLETAERLLEPQSPARPQ